MTRRNGKYEAMNAAGVAETEIVAAMRTDGLSIIDAIKAARSVFGISLGAAKQIISEHAAWREEAAKSDALHAELLNILDHIAEPIVLEAERQHRNFYLDDPFEAARLLARGTWLYDGVAPFPVSIIVFPFDYWLEVGPGDYKDGPVEPTPIGPDGCLYYVSFGEGRVDGQGYPTLEEAKAEAQRCVANIIVWDS